MIEDDGKKYNNAEDGKMPDTLFTFPSQTVILSAYTLIGGIPNWARHPSADALEANAIFYKVLKP